MTKTALYRHFDCCGALLYVGISLCAIQRLTQHSEGSAWYQQIARVAIEWHESREAALRAESKAIVTEHPLFNVRGREPVVFAIEHVTPRRHRDGNYTPDVAAEVFRWWCDNHPRDSFRLVSAPASKVGGAIGYSGILRPSDFVARSWA